MLTTWPLAHAGLGSSAALSENVTVVGAALLAATAYGRGARRVPLAVLPYSRRAAFAAGLVVSTTTLVGPVAQHAESSFSWHMAQHMVLLLVVPGLLVLGRPGLALLLALPPDGRRAAARLRHRSGVRRVRTVAAATGTAWAAQTAGLWGWHLPVAYQAALRFPIVHVLEHGTFVVVGALFWAQVQQAHARLEGLRGAAFVFVSILPTAALGAVLTLASSPLYPAQSPVGRDAALADQQRAGLIMWAPPDVLYLLTIAVLLLSWLRRLDAGSPRGVPLPSAVPPALPTGAP